MAAVASQARFRSGKDKGRMSRYAVLLCAGLVSTCVFGDGTSSDTPARVELTWAEPVSLEREHESALHESASALLATSQFNSVQHTNILTPSNAQIQKRYSATVSGRHLLIAYDEPKQVETMGGVLPVRKIVVGLDREDYAASLFTIDDRGAVVEHAKYDGGKCIELLEEVRRLMETLPSSGAAAGTTDDPSRPGP